MYRQNGERIDQQLIASANDAMHLLLGTILRTQETGALGYRLGINLSACRADASRIELSLHFEGVSNQFLGFHTL